ncbi:MAG: thioredoxin family protein, partial [Wenyingzhuangia sp.]
FNDYDMGLAYAKKVGKPVMIDFTGKACVNCRKMEQNVWVKPKVLEILKELWQITRAECWFQKSTRRSHHYHGCGFTR